jgi:hypothetical protein
MSLQWILLRLLVPLVESPEFLVLILQLVERSVPVVEILAVVEL